MVLFSRALPLLRQVLPEFYVHPDRFVDTELDGATKKAFRRTLDLFVSIKQEYTRLMKMGDEPSGSNALAEPERGSIYSESISFDEFFVVMALDELELEKAEGDLGLSRHVFCMVDVMQDDFGGGTSGDGALSREKLSRAFQGVPKHSQRDVDDFLYLFNLNHDGHVDEHEFLREVRHLRVMTHED